MKPKNFFATLFFLMALCISSALAADDNIYNTAPKFSPYSAGSVKSSVLNEALNELNYIRGLVGVPNNVKLNSDYTNKAQHGAVLLDAINTLTHTPARPSGMSESFYKLAYDGTTHGNLSFGMKSINGKTFGDMTLIKAIRNCMDDSDNSNISAVGHRRWLMNPRMKQAGFGISTRRGYAVTYVIEETGKTKWPIDDEFITWPTRKTPQPLELFNKNTAWSVTLNSDIFDKCTDKNIRVKLTKDGDKKIWNFSTSSSKSGFFKVNHDSIAYDECIIFRPNNATYKAGDTWRVEISGLKRKGADWSISFPVRFTDGTANTNTNTDTVTTTTTTTPTEETNAKRRIIQKLEDAGQNNNTGNPSRRRRVGQ